VVPTKHSNIQVVSPIKLSHTLAEFLFGASLEISSDEITYDEGVHRGLRSKLSYLQPVISGHGTDNDGPFSEIVVPDFFPPGSVLVFATHMKGLDHNLGEFIRSGIDDVVAPLDLVDLNFMLYRADGEERDLTNNAVGTYHIDGIGNLTYCGLEGWMHPLRHVMKYNDLGHPLAEHLRTGTWAMKYIYSRLFRRVFSCSFSSHSHCCCRLADSFPHLKEPANWVKSRFDRIESSVPAFLRPKYFAIVVYELYKACRRAAIEQMSEFIASSDSFTQNLALTSVQMYGHVTSASLNPGKPVPSLAAGLPHFASGWARTWGRDVFISLRGLFLTTGNFSAARAHILAFCSTVKHGLIPNLLDSVRSPRYNSRDSPWWMLQSIQDYVSMAPDGLSILRESVKRRFPMDDFYIEWSDPRAYTESNTVAEIIQEILQRHADGISFRECNAGPNLDMQMKNEGFYINIWVDWETGLIHGGNEFNCGTWMDKMGESVKAGTKGLPGTPRDGAPVEITGLLKSTLRWLTDLSSRGEFPYKGVESNCESSHFKGPVELNGDSRGSTSSRHIR
jgi:glycogen debranching enzyme